MKQVTLKNHEGKIIHQETDEKISLLQAQLLVIAFACGYHEARTDAGLPEVTLSWATVEV
jgi:hypothetical protein